jgi:protein-disulfide isomerase
MTRLISAAAIAAALVVAGCQKAEDAAFGQQVRAYLLEHPEVLEEAFQKLQEKKLVQAASAVKAAVDKNRAALERDPRDFVANPDGRITVTEFYDYRCGYCKLAAPEITKLIAENPDVRFVFKELPIFGGVSAAAAAVILTPQAKPKTLELHRAFMAEKALDEAAIDRHLRSVGIDPAAAKAAAESGGIRKHLEDTQQLAQSLQVEGTPAFVVGDRVIPGADMAALRAAIAEARTGKLKTIDDA